MKMLSSKLTAVVTVIALIAIRADAQNSDGLFSSNTDAKTVWQDA